MKTYIILRKPNILDWNKIPSVSIENQPLTQSEGISATGQICYDNEALYVRLTAKESPIRAEYMGLLDSPCEDSCLEFFFSPVSDDQRYFNIEYNPNCCVYLGIGSSIKDLVRLIPEGGVPFSPKVSTTSDGWEITYQIPYSFIRRFFPDFSPESGKRMRGNFYKCGELTAVEHYLSWSEITCTDEPGCFHRSCDFGVLEFE